VWAGVELGGTRCRCILGTGPDDIRAEEELPTSDPSTTLPAIAAVLERFRRAFGAPAGLGIASFGPLDLRRDSAAYGRMGATPKPLWRNLDLLGAFAAHVAAPVAITTDVIGAALAEGRWGAARGLADFAYVTVGTGVGVGLIVSGRAVVGCHHPELGHIRIARPPDDRWPGSCPFHGDCVEGLASGPAIEARTGVRAADIPADSPLWATVAHALAQLAQALVLAVAPRRIVMGGGVLSHQPHLFPRIRSALAASLAGYIAVEELTSGLDRYIVPALLGTRAGALGALALAAGIAGPPAHPAESPRPPGRGRPDRPRGRHRA
jgi:fructokinase